MARSSSRGGRGGGRGRGNGHSSTDNGGGRGQCGGHSSMENGGQLTSDAYHSHHEASDDDEPVVAPGRGPNIPTPLPTFENRIWIWVEHDEFNIQDKVSRTIGSILKSMWSGPWQGWKDVPFHHRERMFERFQKYYVWEEQSKSLIYSCWETCIKGKFPDLLMRARNKAKALAIQEGIEVRDDLNVILPFKPHWISQESWATLVKSWNTNSWKGKSSINIDNRKKAKGGRHTLGSKSFVTVRHNLDKTSKRRATFDEYWLQTHAKKGSRPLDRLAGHSMSVADDSGEVNDMEETVHEHNVTWVDSRARESYETYKDYVKEKNEENDNLDPEFDMDLWLRTTGGRKKGRVYGSSNNTDPYVVMAGASTMPSTDSSYPPGRCDEVQRLKEQIEQDKVEKQAMMEKIEENAKLYAEMNEKLQLLLKNQQNLPPR